MQHACCTYSETSFYIENFYIDFSILLFFDMQMLLVFSLIFFFFWKLFFIFVANIFCCLPKAEAVTIFRLNLPATSPHTHTYTLKHNVCVSFESFGCSQAFLHLFKSQLRFIHVCALHFLATDKFTKCNRPTSMHTLTLSPLWPCHMAMYSKSLGLFSNAIKGNNFFNCKTFFETFLMPVSRSLHWQPLWIIYLI